MYSEMSEAFNPVVVLERRVSAKPEVECACVFDRARAFAHFRSAHEHLRRWFGSAARFDLSASFSIHAPAHLTRPFL